MKKNKQPVRRSTPVWVWLLAGVAVVALAFLAIGLMRPDAPVATAGGYPAEISVAEAAEKRDAGAFILDVREPSEWEAGHIPGATLIPLGQLSQRANELPQDQEIVVICRSGNRSAQGRDILKSAGFEQVTSVAGGMNDWTAQGLPVVTGP